MEIRMEKKSLNEIFFNASSAAALAAYKKSGKIPVAISALVKSGDDYVLIPIGAGLPEMDVRLAQTMLDTAVKPLVEYVNQNNGSYPLIFFLSCTGEGMTRDTDTGDMEEVKVIINAARGQDKRGRTDVYRISSDKFVKLVLPQGDTWVETPDDRDLPSSIAQQLLDMVWKSFIVSKNVSSLTNSKAS